VVEQGEIVELGTKIYELASNPRPAEALLTSLRYLQEFSRITGAHDIKVFGHYVGPPHNPSTCNGIGLEDDYRRHSSAKHPLSRALAGAHKREGPCALR
jgi:hypothetical protein